MSLFLLWASLFNPLFSGWFSIVFFFLGFYGLLFTTIYFHYNFQTLDIFEKIPNMHIKHGIHVFIQNHEKIVRNLNYFYERLTEKHKIFYGIGLLTLSLGVLGNTSFNDEFAMIQAQQAVSSITGVSIQNENHKNYLISISMLNDQSCRVMYSSTTLPPNVCLSNLTDREHVWLSSRLSNDNFEQGDLHNIWLTKKADNLARGEKAFGENLSDALVYVPLDEWKGDIARSLFYVAIKYFSFDRLIESHRRYLLLKENEKAEYIQMLLRWNQQDPVSDFERQRNQAIEKLANHENFQNQNRIFGRNPFIDNPHFADMIW